MPFHPLQLDLHRARVPGRSSGKVRIETDVVTYKLRPSTLATYLPTLYGRLEDGRLGHFRHGHTTLDLRRHTHTHARFHDEYAQRALHRALEYIEDLEIRGGQSTMLFDRLVKTMDSSRSIITDYRSRLSPVTQLFRALGRLFDESELGCNRTVFAAMEAFWVHRSQEICRMMSAAEIMTYIYALDGMRGSMTSSLAALKAGLGSGRSMRGLVDHCRRQTRALSPRTQQEMVMMLGQSFGSGDIGGRKGGFQEHLRPGRGHGDVFDGGRRGVGGIELVMKDVVHIHARHNGDAFTYEAYDAPRGYVRAIPRRFGGDGQRGRHYEAHHYHLGGMRDDRHFEDDRYSQDDDFGDRMSDDHRVERGHFGRSPRRRSISVESDDSSSRGRFHGGYRSD